MVELLLIGGIIYWLMEKDKSNTGTLAQRYVWPVSGSIRITSRFGEKRATGTHNGLDIAVPVNTPVLAIAAGAIESIFSNTAGGNSLIIKHDGGLTVGYAHLNRNNVFKVGDKVKQGEVVAYSGNTGRSSGPHLHITTRINGTHINPETILPKL